MQECTARGGGELETFDVGSHRGKDEGPRGKENTVDD